MSSAAPSATSNSAARADRTQELPFIEDDYPRAVERAKATKKNIYVEAWGTWCHSCLSMRSFVLTEPKVLAHASDVIWLALDVDKKENEAILKRLLPPALPTMWLLDPDGTVKTRWVGTMSADEVVSFVSVPNAVRSVTARATDLYEEKKYEECVTLVSDELKKKAKPSADLVGALTIGLGCTMKLKKDEETKRFASELRGAVNDFSYTIVADDRSGAYEMLVDALGEMKDETARMDEARHWSIFLEEEARRAKTPRERVVFDPHRLIAYTETNQVKKAIPMLQASERDFPEDFNPPARLARAFLALGQVKEAGEAIDRAIARGYGPRKLRLFEIKADVADAAGDKSAAKKALDEAVQFSKGLSLSPNYEKYVRGLEARREKLG